MSSSTVTANESEQKIASLQREVDALKHQLDWFKRQLLGSKSEKRVFEDPKQLALGDILSTPIPPGPEQQKIPVSYERGKGLKDRGADCVNDTGLRFDDSVPVTVIRLPVAELDGLGADEYEVIDIKRTFKLAQRPASYEVICYERPVVKLKASQKLVSGITPLAVLENSLADVSFLVGMLVDKFRFHLPLYRQHQRIEAAGIKLSRATLTGLVQRAIALLVPIVDAQRDHVLLSKILAMDETPIKVGPKNKSNGKKTKSKMHQGYYWPLYGEDDEVVFTYSESRARLVIEKILCDSFNGTLVSDGYAAYAAYAKANQQVTHAQCWVHTRRKFVEAEDDEPVFVQEILLMIQTLYKHEAQIRADELEGEAKLTYRSKHCKPVVDEIFAWCDEQCQAMDLLPQSPFAKALAYLRERRTELQVFLEDPDVPVDTNHLERAIRPIPMGRRNWLFCWNELGAQHVGVIQSLITTCRLHNVDPYVYLVDVLQRVSVHPAKDVIELTPRVWKTKFAGDPMRSDLELGDKYVAK